MKGKRQEASSIRARLETGFESKELRKNTHPFRSPPRRGFAAVGVNGNEWMIRGSSYFDRLSMTNGSKAILSKDKCYK